QWQLRNPLFQLLPFGLAGVDGETRAITRLELVQLDEDDAAFLAEGCMYEAGRIAEVGAGREVTRFIREDAIEDEDLLAQRVVVATEGCPGVVAHHGGRVATLGLLAGQGFAPHTGRRARQPVHAAGVEG